LRYRKVNKAAPQGFSDNGACSWSCLQSVTGSGVRESEVGTQEAEVADGGADGGTVEAAVVF